MNLYKIRANQFKSFFGHHEKRDLGTLTEVQNLHHSNTTIIAQLPDCSAFLLLTNETYSNLELQDSVPSGYDFTYCQEWGLEVNQIKIDRVIAEL